MNLARRGARQLTDEKESITDQGELAQVRRQARGVIFKASLAATLLSVITLFLPQK